MSAPLIFIHYGDCAYLQHTLRSAVLFNPDKRVILLGDEHNAHYQSLGLEHVPFAQYEGEAEVELFDTVYRYVAGKEHRREEWTRFVFRRWLLIHSFLAANGIHRFWTFDSDTLILTRLAEHEATFAGYDCTEQCSGICMNGLVNNVDVVRGYARKINRLFQDVSFMNRQEALLRRLPRYAYTEMRAYVEFRDEATFRSARLGDVVNGETFLDSICTVDEHRWFLDDDVYETYDEPLDGYRVKKLYLEPDGHVYAWHLPTQRLVRLNSINMSWVPDWLPAKVLRHARRRLISGGRFEAPRGEVPARGPIGRIADWFSTRMPLRTGRAPRAGAPLDAACSGSPEPEGRTDEARRAALPVLALDGDAACVERD